MSREGKNRKGGVGRKLLYIFTSLLGVAVILASVAYGGFYHYYSKMNIVDVDENGYGYVSDDDINSSEAFDTESQEEQVNPWDLPYGEVEYEYDFNDPDITNIMIIGTDSRKKGLWRTATDTMILVSINKKTQKVFMTSFMRDIQVYIKKGGNHREAGNDKLNAAYAYGDSKMMFETIEENFGIKIDKFVHLDFYSFVTLVDAIGGVDMYVTSKEIKYMNTVYLYEINKTLYHRPRGTDYLPYKTGKFHLNGKQALAYTRVRYVGGDYERTERQRKVLEEIIKKVKEMSPSKLNKFAERALKCVSTNLSQTEVMSLVMDAPECLSYETISTRIPVDKTYTSKKIKGTYFLIIDLKKNADYWYSLVYYDKDISKEIVQKIKDEKAEAKAKKEAEKAAAEADTATSTDAASPGGDNTSSTSSATSSAA